MDANSARGVLKSVSCRRRRRHRHHCRSTATAAFTAATIRSALRLGVSCLAGMVGGFEDRLRRVPGDEAVRHFRERNRQGETNRVRNKRLQSEIGGGVIVVVGGFIGGVGGGGGGDVAVVVSNDNKTRCCDKLKLSKCK